MAAAQPTSWPAGVPWSIFTQGGGPGAALTWAKDLLAKIGAPASPGNIQFVYDWQASEGGGGAYNPLNQGPVPGDPALTTTGEQYGGGAANYAGWAAGLQGAADYLNMPNYTGVLTALRNNDPTGARAALIASPWAGSHYGGGSSFSDSPVPGQASVLAPAGGTTGASTSSSTNAQTTSAWTDILGAPGLTYLSQTAASAASGVFQKALPGIEKFLLECLFIAAGLGMILLGLTRMFPGTTKLAALAAA